MNARYSASFEQLTSKFGRWVVTKDLLSGRVADVAHAGEASIDFKPYDAWTTRQGTNDCDRLTHNAVEDNRRVQNPRTPMIDNGLLQSAAPYRSSRRGRPTAGA